MTVLVNEESRGIIDEQLPLGRAYRNTWASTFFPIGPAGLFEML